MKDSVPDLVAESDTTGTSGKIWMESKDHITAHVLILNGYTV
jgi:hypothetical protein